MFESEFLPFLFFDGKPNLDDLLDFCGDVFSDNAIVGPGFATMSADDHLHHAADIHCETPVLYVLDVLQDKQDPLKIGRFLQSRKQFFASTSETLLCHAFSVCTVVLVVPKGSTVDQICGPREPYDVLKRIPLQCAPAPGPSMDMNVGIAPKPLNGGTSQPRAQSYADGQTPESNVRPPVSTTVPWTQADNGLGSQMPRPVKSATPKNDEDFPMGEVEGPDQPKNVHKDNNETSYKELGNDVQGGSDFKIPPICKEIVTAQASPLKRASRSINCRTNADPSNSSCEQNFLARTATRNKRRHLAQGLR